MNHRSQKRALRELARIVARDDLTPQERADALRDWAKAQEAPPSPYRAYAGSSSPHGVSALKAGRLRRVVR